jgi:cytidylate kinase
MEESKFVNKNSKQNTSVIAIMIIGRTASGKTSVAYCLSQRLSINYIPVAYYKRLAKPDYQKKDSLNEHLRDLGYKLAIDQAVEFAKQKKSVILDSSFAIKKRRKWMIESLSPYVDEFYMVYCLSSDLIETKKRIQLRKGMEQISIQHHASSFEIFEHINSIFEEPEIDELYGSNYSKSLIKVDTFNKCVYQEKNYTDASIEQIYRCLNRCIKTDPILNIPPIIYV